MSLYADYLAERQGKSVLEREDGFAVFYDFDWAGRRAVYIEEIYVAPHARQSGTASLMADEIAELALERDVTLMVGSVEPTGRNATTSLRVLLSYGFTLDSVSPSGLIMFVKHLEDETDGRS